ncbi:MAG: RNA-binding domain-containing protein [Candidatus Bathyarchaeales archaeon]
MKKDKNSVDDAALSSKVPVTHIDIRVFAHATEDEEKVLSAVRSTLPPKMSEDTAFKKTNLTGHHGNPIILFETKIKDKNHIKAFFENFASRIGILDKEILNSEIGQHLEKGCLYIRLDKQSAFLNEIKLGTTDPIHFRVHFKRSNPKEIVEICRNFGIIP